ncbi:enoyl-CoA hydratase/isomerase family protein [Roseivivax sp. GX 12232]|uniref:enoyl-CoA hydratase/isomerase family protein n=1 Tax=Roseivivax sp. GX 12232 TaxID=2900547 RepID=UPI001E62932E|nr:enoyl-CoA hydratase/isomerase family protein [Roseivivax sp. GX 12232]MCE0504838.1 enoyl-CoA hydratase/isomerase family protein [Roseivivax sp. GX 12232]
MSEVSIRKEGRAGRITLTREKSLNALSHKMCLQIEAALLDWLADEAVSLVILDAAGEKAFCAGGDIAAMYHEGIKGNYDAARAFWRDEYRMNALLAEYPKPILSFAQGFVMGGGVGLGGHVSHRIVGESTQVAMPECGIGLVPDVGGSLLLSRAPGRLGEYLGLTGARMGAGDAIHCGFADRFVPEARWEALKTSLSETGDLAALEAATAPAPESPLAAEQDRLDTLFGSGDLAGILETLRADGSETSAKALKGLSRGSPLSLAVTLELIRRHRAEAQDIRAALALEYRATHRAMDQGDFLEGVRAQVIDKDRSPNWQHDLAALPFEEARAMLAPVPGVALDFHALTEEAGT